MYLLAIVSLIVAFAAALADTGTLSGTPIPAGAYTTICAVVFMVLALIADTEKTRSSNY